MRSLPHGGLDEATVKPNAIRGGLVVSYTRRQGGWRQALPTPPAVLPTWSLKREKGYVWSAALKC